MLNYGGQLPVAVIQEEVFHLSAQWQPANSAQALFLHFFFSPKYLMRLCQAMLGNGLPSRVCLGANTHPAEEPVGPELLNTPVFVNSRHKVAAVLLDAAYLGDRLHWIGGGGKKKRNGGVFGHWDCHQRKERREQRREPFMSLIQVVQGHRARCTLADGPPRIHRSFLFPDVVQAALPQGA